MATALRRLAILAVATWTAAGPAAAATFDECRALLVRTGASREAAACVHDVAAESARWDVAAGLLRAAAQTHPDSGWVRYYLGEVTARTASAEALPHYRAAVDRFKRFGDVAGEAHARDGLALALFRSGKGQEGAAESETAVAVARASGETLVMAQALADRAWISLQRSERLAAALRELREAESLAFPGGPYPLRMRVVARLGGTLFALGRYEQARAQYEALIDLAHANGDTSIEALAHFNLLTTRRRQMEALPDRALLGEFVDQARTGLALADATGQATRQAGAHRALADLLASAGNRDDAAAHYQAALLYARQSGDRADLSEGLWALGRALADTDPAASKALLDEALQVAVDAGSPEQVAYAWRQRMRLAWKTLPAEGAVDESRRALEAIETIRDLQGAPAGRAEVFSPWTLDYYWLAGTMLGQPAPTRSDLALGFEVTERMRARVLLDALRRDAPETREATPLAEKRRDLLRAMSDVQRRLLDPRVDAASRTALARDLERLEREEASVRAEIDAAEGPGPAFASLGEVERALAPDEAILAYTIGLDQNFYGEFGGGASLLVISRAGTRLVRTPDRVRLHHAIAIFRGLAEHADRIEAPASVALYDALLKSALELLPREVTRLVIVPDGPLHHLPFAALRPAPAAPSVGEVRQLVTAPSATVWLRLRERGLAPAPGGALVMADPELAESQRSDRAAEERGWGPAAMRLGALPFARAEGRAILSRLGGNGRLLMGQDASEPALKAADPRSYRLLHLAAHALVDEEYPERSAIFVASGAGGDDGLLQAREIADLRLNGQIVVLSACSSATGAVLAGEGVMGLSRAFLEAGAGVVVGSLWAMRDDHAAQFFDGFYASLGRGKPVGAALTDARRLAIARGLPASAWSSIVAIGNDRLTVDAGTPDRRPGRLAALLGVGAVVFVIATLAWRSRRRRPVA